MRNNWTKEEIDIIRNNYKHLSDKELHKLLPRHTEKSVTTKRKCLGCKRSNRKYSFDDVIEVFKSTNYILLSGKEEYFDAAINSLKYICWKHKQYGEQFISLGHLLDGRGCYYCGREKTENAHKLSLDEKQLFIDLCDKKGFIFHDVYREKSKIHIQYLCKNHIDLGIKTMEYQNMKREFVNGCPFCVDKKRTLMSNGEKSIKKWLENNEIKFIPQFKFDSCKDQLPLPFDFYIPELNICIEYDGQHHYYPVNYNGISDEKALKCHQISKRHDKIKDAFCLKRNIKLIRIPYYEYKSINNILEHNIKINSKGDKLTA